MNGDAANKPKACEAQASAKLAHLQRSTLSSRSQQKATLTTEDATTPLNKSTSVTPDHLPAKGKQTLEDVPHELLERMKESGKRKPISVIPAIPSKKIRTDRNVSL